MPASLSVRVSASCDSGGIGNFTVSLINFPAGESVTVTMVEGVNNFSAIFSGGGAPQTITGIPNGVYGITASSATEPNGEIYVNGSNSPSLDKEIDVNCTPPSPPPSCDLVIGSVTKVNTTGGFNNGRATINATGTGTIQYSINGETWQSSNVFYNLPIGVYTAYIRKIGQLSCGDNAGFEIAATPVLGCTNPGATNYNPAATQDNGTCLYVSKFYACGGVLPNPVNIEISLPVSTDGIAKTNHYVKLNIYKDGATTPFATATQSLRNGKTTIDISRYLQTQFNNAYQEPTSAVIFKDEAQSFGFYIGIVEHYNGMAQAEVIKTMPPRVAVNAALPEYTDTVAPFLISGVGGISEPTPPES